MLDAGDVILRFTEARFSGVEVTTIAGISVAALRNWQIRGSVLLGDGSHNSRRYSLKDGLVLAIVGQLTTIGMTPPAAGRVAELSAHLAKDMPGFGGPPHTGAYRPNLNLLLGFDAAGALVPLSAELGKGPGRYYPPTLAQVLASPEMAPFRRPHIVLPLHSILGDVIERIAALPAKSPAQIEAEQEQAAADG